MIPILVQSIVNVILYRDMLYLKVFLEILGTKHS